jgi:hypothetical protein
MGQNGQRGTKGQRQAWAGRGNGRATGRRGMIGRLDGALRYLCFATLLASVNRPPARSGQGVCHSHAVVVALKYLNSLA